MSIDSEGDGSSWSKVTPLDGYVSAGDDAPVEEQGRRRLSMTAQQWQQEQRTQTTYHHDANSRHQDGFGMPASRVLQSFPRYAPGAPGQRLRMCM
jgi:hypothetical protein